MGAQLPHPHAKRKRGRPTKLTKELAQKICDVIRAGNYLEVAAAYCGIDKSTLFDWLKRGARESSGPYREFSASVEIALAAAEVRDVAVVGRASDKEWTAAAWRLERKFPARWGRGERRQDGDEDSLKLKLEKLQAEIEVLRARAKNMTGMPKDDYQITVVMRDYGLDEEDQVTQISQQGEKGH